MNSTSSILESDDKKKKKKRLTKKILYCSNCGNNGHGFKSCLLPITSYGIININITDIDKEKVLDLGEKLCNLKKLRGIEVMNQTEVEKFTKFKDNVKFLLIRRKHTLGFMEFVRGHYKIDNIEGIIYLFKQMVRKEIDKIATKDFDTIWTYAWSGNGNKNKNREIEYKTSKSKFDKLIEGFEEILNLDFYVNNVKPKWNTPEWGFPKGRRNYGETDYECAIREFEEESTVDKNSINILKNYSPLEENFTGTNGVFYKHIYYLSLSNTDNNVNMEINNNILSNEIGDIGYFSFYETLEKIRPYHTERVRLITELYINIMTQIMNIHKS